MLVCAASHKWQDFANHLVDASRFEGALIEWQLKGQLAPSVVWGAGCLAPNVRRATTTAASPNTLWAATADAQDLRLTISLDLPAMPPALNGSRTASFGPIKRALKTSLHPAVDIAATSRNRIVAATQAGALHACPLPAFVVDANATVIGMNARARAELTDAQGAIKMTATSVLQLPTPDATRALADAARAQSIGLAQSPSFLILRDGGHGISGIISLARRSIPEVGIAPPFVIVTFAALSRLRPIPDDQMKEAFGLTSSETALANAIGSGVSIKSYATSYGVAESTVRWHLHNVLQSVDVDNQIELARVFVALQIMLS